MNHIMDKKIGIIGYFGHGNAGDEAMKDVLLMHFPGAIANNLGVIEKCDAYIIAGGDLVQEFSGLHLPEVWESVTTEPCYAMSLGAKLGWEKHQELVVRLLTKFRKIYTREQESFDILSRFVRVDAVMPDLVLLADAEPSSKKYPILFNYTDRPWIEPGGQYQDVLKQGDIYPVALSSQEFDPKYANEAVTWSEFISMAKSSAGVIGTRLHAVVMGVIAGVPVAAISYEDKVRKFCQRYNIPCFEYGKHNGQEIVKSMRKADIDLDAERAKILKVIFEIKASLNASERDAAITELLNVYTSTSWRITKPIRSLESWAKPYVKLCQLVLAKSGHAFTRARIIKGLKLLEKGDVSGLKTSLKRVASEIQKQVGRAIEPEFISSCPLSPGQPLVSVVIPCFNYGQFVTDAVASVLAQTLRNVEIIVIDGGSTDAATLEILGTMQLPRTTVLFREGRHLVGDNRNFGIEKAQGRYICCLDADDMLEPTYLEKAVFYLETYGYDVVSTAINFIGAREGHIDVLAYPDLNDMVSGNHVLTCAVFRKQLWDASGGFFDVGTGKHHVAEDWDFWLRLAAKGARIRNISGEYLFNYRIHTGGSLSSASDVKSLPDQRAAILNRNRQLLTSKAFRISKQGQAKYLWCNPSCTALANGLNTAPLLRKMTLLLTMPFFMIGGSEKLLSGLCSYLANNNWRIIVVSTLGHDATLGNSIDWFRESTSELYELTRFLEPREWNDFMLYLLSSRKPDCLLNTGSRLMYELLPAIAAGGNDPCIIDLLFNTVGHVESHLEFRKFITFALAENHEVYNWLLSEATWPSDRVGLVSSGIDLQHLRPADRPNDLVTKYGITEDELVIGFSGRLSEEKAPDCFVEIAKLCSYMSNIRFIMTGGGPMSSDIVKQVELLPSMVKFEFAGLVEDINTYITLYDLLILPSRLDGRPLIVMQALACGVPVIASNIGGLPDLIEDGVNGYLVETGNLDKFAEKIRTINEDRVLLKRLKSGARRMAEEKLDSNRAYYDYEFFFKKALNIHNIIRN